MDQIEIGDHVWFVITLNYLNVVIFGEVLLEADTNLRCVITDDERMFCVDKKDLTKITR